MSDYLYFGPRIFPRSSISHIMHIASYTSRESSVDITLAIWNDKTQDDSNSMIIFLIERVAWIFPFTYESLAYLNV